MIIRCNGPWPRNYSRLFYHNNRWSEDLEEKKDNYTRRKGVEYKCEEVKEIHLTGAKGSLIVN